MRLVLALGMAIAVLATACGHGHISPPPSPTTPTATPTSPQSLLDPHGNVTLYVANDSPSLPRVDISLVIDGQPILNRSLANRFAAHPKPLRLRLSSGRHLLEVTSLRGDAHLSERFSIDGKRWLSVAYFYNDGTSGTPEKRQFLFRSQAHPMLFD